MTNFVVVRHPVLAALAVLASIAAVSPAAGADAYTAPTLTAAGGTQRGAPVYATVHKAGGGRCSAHHIDYTGEFPAPAAHSGTALSWRVADARRPVKVSVTLARLGTDRATLGPGEAVAVTLAPVRSGSRTVAWSVRSGEVGYGDLHLDVTITWPKGPCGADGGRYRYRLQSLPPVL